MKIKRFFLQSRVARRIFALFILCALIPITILAVITYTNMTSQLYDQTKRELQQISKSMGMAIFERLLLIESEMKMVVSNLGLPANVIDQHELPLVNSGIQDRFKGLIWFPGEDESIILFGHLPEVPSLENAEKQKIFSGKTLILTKPIPQGQSQIFMVSAYHNKDKGMSVVLAEIDPMYLWFMGYESPLPAATALCILDSQAATLYSSFEEDITLQRSVLFDLQSSPSGQFEWEYGEEKYLASFWSLFLMSKFYSPDWNVIVFKSKSAMLAPLANFKSTFPWIILVSLWVVLFLSVNQIRKSMVPLEKLKEGTQRIAQTDFDSHVEVNSHDEFADLADSFNTMANQLGRQFKTLTAMVDIDRAILLALDTEKIVEIVLEHMRHVFPCDSVSISLMAPKEEGSMRTYINTGNPRSELYTEFVNIREEEVQRLQDNPDKLFFTKDKNIPKYLLRMAGAESISYLVFPMFFKSELSGIIVLGYNHTPSIEQEDIEHARQLTEQVAVALSNMRLIEELSQFNIGTLTAFARAIDAKSPWTAGHSERVTQIALKIGKKLKLTSHEMDILHRGGLLHDVGKLGVSHEILDKPGALDQEERMFIEKHVILGVRILEPIPAYSEILPLIKQHHESFDGSGYPEGLSGESINLYARILAVADRFEALTSDRPYRKALSQKAALDFVKKHAGKEFDPKVVKAFLEIVT